MATAGFGFSAGDIVQAIVLCNKIRSALKDSGGAKDEFKNFMIDLQHLEVSLDQLNCGSWTVGGDAGQLNAIKGMALTCKVPLQELLAKIEKFRILGNENLVGIKMRLAGQATRVRWGIQMKEELEKFRAVIMAKVISINMLLQLNLVQVYLTMLSVKS